MLARRNELVVERQALAEVEICLSSRNGMAPSETKKHRDASVAHKN
jgi:hypothetical protein